MEHYSYVSHYCLPDGVSFNSRIWLSRMERHLHIFNATNDCILLHSNGRYLSYTTKNGISIRTVNKGHENFG